MVILLPHHVPLIKDQNPEDWLVIRNNDNLNTTIEIVTLVRNFLLIIVI